MRESSNAQQAAKPRRARGSISGTTIATYLGVFLLIVSMIVLAYHPPVNQKALADASNGASASQQNQAAANVSVDQLVATDLASSLADSTGMPVSSDIANLSQSLSIESVLAQTDSNVISKPQIIQPTADGRVIQYYTTVAGDTASSVGASYGISAQTIEWANGLTSEALNPNQRLTILPVDGILYTVKTGDTLDSIVSKYGTDRASIVAFNDLELTGNPPVGTRLILPGGVLPANERPGYTAPVNTGVQFTSFSGGTTWKAAQRWTGPIQDNGYPFGQCTWYAAMRRAQLGMPVGRQWGNGGSWANSGRAAGRLVDGNPSAGAIMVNGGGYGHVAIVEAVNPGESVFISEMNGYRGGGGWGTVGYIVIPWSEATSGYYSYVH